MVVALARALHKFPHEVDELPLDEFWELLASFKIERDEREERRSAQ